MAESGRSTLTPDTRSLRELADVAAYLEGKLSSAERQRLAKRLVEDDALFEIYTAALELRAEEERQAPAQIPGTRRWIPAAAIATLGAAASLAVVLLRPTAVPVDVLVDRLSQIPDTSEYLSDGGSELGWSELRAVEAPKALDGEAIVARLAVRLVQIRVAVREPSAGELPETLVGNIRTLCAARDQQIEVDLYSTRLAEVLPESGYSSTLERSVPNIANVLREAAIADENGEVFDLAQWAEIGRLASRLGRDDVLASRAFSRRARELSTKSFEPSVQEQLDRAVEGLSTGALTATEGDFTALVLALAD